MIILSVYTDCREKEVTKTQFLIEFQAFHRITLFMFDLRRIQNFL